LKAVKFHKSNETLQYQLFKFCLEALLLLFSFGKLEPKSLEGNRCTASWDGSQAECYSKKVLVLCQGIRGKCSPTVLFGVYDYKHTEFHHVSLFCLTGW